MAENNAKNVVENAVGSAAKAGSEGVDKMKEFTEDAAGKAKDFTEDAVENVKGLGSKIAGFFKHGK